MELLLKKNKLYIDLHIHSNHSTDGQEKLEDILYMAKEVGLDVISITDHDSMNVYEEVFERKDFGGADFIVIPCNTVHAHIDRLRENIRIPVLSIIEEPVKYLKEHHVSRVAVLATNQTIKQNLYKAALNKVGIDFVLPGERMQQKINEVIMAILANQDTESDKEKMYGVIHQLKMLGIKNILLACTDLQLLVKHMDVSVKVYDTMDILVKASIREATSKNYQYVF